jgi:hypothetical protein
MEARCAGFWRSWLLPVMAVVLVLAGLAAITVPAHAADTNTIEDNFTRANQSGWGTTTNNGGVPNVAWGMDGTNTSITSISSNTGKYAYQGSINQIGIASAGSTTYNGGDALAEVSLSAVGHGTPYISLNACGDKSCYYGARIHTSQNLFELAKRRSGSTTVEKSVSFTATAGTKCWIRLNYNSSTHVLSGKVWAAGTTEPSGWTLQWTDGSSQLSAGYPGAGGSWDQTGTGEYFSYYCYAYSSSASTSAQPCAAAPSGPTVSSFTPGSGGAGDSVTITGSGFTGASSVKFAGTSAQSFTVNSDTQITAVVPSGQAGTSGTVCVTTSGGTGCSSSNFTITVALLHTSGTKILDPNNNPAFLKGVNRFSFEFDCPNGDGHFTSSDFAAIKSWGANFVRFPLSEVFWLDEGGCGGSSYQTAVANAVSAAEAKGLYVELDLHRDDPFVGQSCDSTTSGGGDEYALPDSASETFWQQVSHAYANDKGVLFGIYNEPNNLPAGTTGWNDWQNGMTGYVEQPSQPCPGLTWNPVGFQTIITNDIHPYAPNVPVVASGAYDYASRLDCIQGEVDNNGCGDNGHALTGQSSITYNVHQYGDATTNEAPYSFNAYWLYTANVYPVIMDEFGTSSGNATNECPYVYEAMRAADAGIDGYAPWVWDASGTQGMGLLATGDWSGNPSTYGAPIKDYFLGSPDSTCLAADTTPSITFGTTTVSPSPVAAGGEITIQSPMTASSDHAVEVDWQLTDASTGQTIATPKWSALYLEGSNQQTLQRKYYLSSGFVSGHTYNITVVVRNANGGSTIATATNAASFSVS